MISRRIAHVVIPDVNSIPAKPIKGAIFPNHAMVDESPKCVVNVIVEPSITRIDQFGNLICRQGLSGVKLANDQIHSLLNAEIDNQTPIAQSHLTVMGGE
jgi:hypothetical protein